MQYAPYALTTTMINLDTWAQDHDHHSINSIKHGSKFTLRSSFALNSVYKAFGWKSISYQHELQKVLTITAAKYMLVTPYMMIKMLWSVKFLKQTYRPTVMEKTVSPLEYWNSLPFYKSSSKTRQFMLCWECTVTLNTMPANSRLQSSRLNRDC